MIFIASFAFAQTRPDSSCLEPPAPHILMQKTENAIARNWVGAPGVELSRGRFLLRVRGVFCSASLVRGYSFFSKARPLCPSNRSVPSGVFRSRVRIGTLLQGHGLLGKSGLALDAGSAAAADCSARLGKI